MLKRTKILAASAAFAFCAATASADGHAEVDASTVIATVNGTEITLGHLIAAAAELPQQYQQLPDNVLFEGLIEQVVSQQLLSESLEIEPAPVTIGIENTIRTLRAIAAADEIANGDVADADLQAAYEEAIAGVEVTPEYNASHILVATLEEAQDVKDMIDGGADFAQTAQEKSTGPSGPSGGELGWFGPGMMVAPFEEAVLKLEVGEVSDPVETQFGWHIVKLNDSRMSELPTLDALRAELTAQIQQDRITATLDALRDDADIALPEEGQFDPAIIRNVQLIEE